MAARRAGNGVAGPEESLACSGRGEIPALLERGAYTTPFAVPHGVDPEVPQTRVTRQSSRPGEGTAVGSRASEPVVVPRGECAARSCACVGAARSSDERGARE